jgi:ligand-binding sensor domain-containing protein
LAAASSPRAQAVRDWANYTDVRDVAAITSQGDSLWLATSGGLVRILQSDPSVEWRFTNADGLGDNNLRFVTIDSAGFLWAGGENGRLCRRRNDKHWDVFTFEDETGLPIRLNAASPGPDGFLWVASDKGVHKFDTRRNGGEIKESYSRIGDWPDQSHVNDIAVLYGTVWAVGPGGTASADVSDPFLLDRAHWSTLSLGETATRVSGTGIGSHVLVGTESGLVCMRVGSGCVPINPFHTLHNVRGLSSCGTDIWVAFDDGVGHYDGTDFTEDLAPGTIKAGFSAVHCSSDRIWLGQTSHGVWRNEANVWTNFEFNGPLDNLFIDVAVDEAGRVWCAHSSTGADFLANGTWTNLPYIVAGTSGPLQSVDVAPDGYVWYGAFGDGAWRIKEDSPFDDSVIFHYKKPNSSLMWVQNPSRPVDYEYVVVEDGVVDSKGRVWLTNGFADSGAVIAFYDHGCWGRFDASDGLFSNRPIVIYPLDQSLLVGFGNYGIVEINYTEPLCDGNSQRPQNVTLTHRTTDQGLPSDEVRALTIDQNDSLWAGTTLGLARYARDRRKFFKVNLPADAGLTVNALAVDAGNSVWVGTTLGLTIIDPDGTMSFFDSHNSGLIGDNVVEINMDDKNGDVWIATRSGLSRTRGPLPRAASIKSVVAYPNPFVIGPTATASRVRFNAPAGSHVYITTVAGDPVVDFDAPLGWDGSSAVGTTVATGVYLFVVRGESGDFGRGKIAVLHRD